MRGARAKLIRKTANKIWQMNKQLNPRRIYRRLKRFHARKGLVTRHVGV